ncbi:MAG: hypothetical protein H7X93_00120 [Sphingomonadaceae bacterium]|nr:hypothetical protein [Sphingomonadaceae bacterium]
MTGLVAARTLSLQLIAVLFLLTMLPMAAAIAVQSEGPPDLARYVGLYPWDRVSGVRFMDHPLVRRAVRNAAPNGAIVDQIFEDATAGEIVVNGMLVLASGCQPHYCSMHNWSIVIGRRAQAHFICYKPDGQRARWYRRHRVVASGETCPFEASDVPPEVLTQLY